MLALIRQHIADVSPEDVRIFIFDGARCSVRYADSDVMNPFVTFSDGQTLPIMAPLAGDLLESESGEIIKPQEIEQVKQEQEHDEDDEDDFGF